MTGGRGRPAVALWAQGEAAEAEPGTLRAALDAAITVEAAGVVLAGVGRLRGVDGDLALDGDDLSFLRAAQCQDEAHYHLLETLGGRSAAVAFSLPPEAEADRAGFLGAMIELEGIAVAAAMALARRFGEIGEGRLIEVAYQLGAGDAQHEALARFLRGDRPANERAFARWRFADAGQALAALADAGFLDPTVETWVFPGPVDRVCRGVFGLVPETTEDAPASLIPDGQGEGEGEGGRPERTRERRNADENDG